MRLIHMKALELCEYIGSSVPKYTILSHNWGEEEVSFSQFSNPQSHHLAGYGKIKAFCKKSLEISDAEYGWVDTCCIDKSSSAELSEAINSMFQWYRNSDNCIVFLSDMPAANPPAVEGLQAAWIQGRVAEFKRCRWFRRGWTLQELIAPPKVAFFDQRWTFVGDKTSM